MKSFLSLIFVFIALLSNAQTNSLRVNSGILLPKDSIESKALTNSLNNFLSSAQKPNEENIFVLENEKIETFILLDEVKGIEKSKEFKDDFFYKPYLTNVTSIENKKYVIQVSYIGINNNQALLKGIFEFIAHKRNGSFIFSSPLLEATKNWKTEKIGNKTFHYKHSIDKSNVKKFHKLTSFYDSKINPPKRTIDYYCCKNSLELQKLIGIQYKLDYNGRMNSVFSSEFGEGKLIILGNNNENFSNFDPHDLWHNQLSLKIPRSKVNRPVDEGCAYLYGGSWGISWEEIFKAFKEQVVSQKPDWRAIKEKRMNFITNGYRNSADNIVNALLVKKIEKERGFEGVWELLTCGPSVKGNKNYYQALEKLTGITKETYNQEIDKLIKNEN